MRRCVPKFLSAMFKPGLSKFLPQGIIFISFIFMHFVISRPLNFPLTPALFVMVLILPQIFSFSGGFFTRAGVLALGGIVGLPLINALQIGYLGGDFVQFLRTYALWMVSAMTITIALIAPLKGELRIETPAFVALAVILGCLLLQTIPAMSGDTSYFNLFGSHQYFGEVQLETLAVDERLRPPGFYLEPSFCAYMVTSLFAICLMAGRYEGPALVLAGISLLLIQSLTGLIGFVVVCAVYFFSAKSKFSGGAYVALIMGVGFVFLATSLYSQYVVDRADQVSSVGSSTYYRTVGLLPVIADVLTEYPLGFALGRVREVIPKYMIPHGLGYGESIDNGLYLLVFYFGWVGLVMVGYLFLRILQSIRMRHQSEAVAWSAVAMGCFFNGGVLLPEFALMSALLFYVGRLKEWVGQ